MRQPTGVTTHILTERFSTSYAARLFFVIGQIDRGSFKLGSPMRSAHSDCRFCAILIGISLSAIAHAAIPATRPATRPATTPASKPSADQGNGSGLLPPVNPDVWNWPTMDYANFMAGHSDETRRQAMWDYFLVVERQAKTLEGARDRWKTIKAVTLGTTGPKWFPTGRLQLGETSAPGTMFHEVFHNTYSGSELHAGQDNAWSEAFCDAFRYMMEESILPDPRTPWFKKVDQYSDLTYAQVMAKSGDKSFDQKYCYPASLIIHAANKNPREFYKLWFTLQKLRNEKNADILNEYFRYDMQSGKPLD